MNQREHATTFYRYFPVGDRDRSWGLYVTTAGEARYQPHAAYPAAGHPEGYTFEWKDGRRLEGYAVVYLSRGQGKFESEATEPIPLSPGDVFVLFPGVWHRYQPDAATGWDEHWIGFDGELARNLVRKKFFSPRNPVIRATREIWVRSLFTGVIEAIQGNVPALQQVLAGMTNHMLGLLFSAQQRREIGGDLSQALVQSAVQHMHANLAAGVNMPALAKQLKVSYSTFRHTFTAHTGMSPLQYMLELRVSLARTLLAETSMPVKLVAERAGFPDEHYFCRFFRHQVGQTPSQWRLRTQRKA